MSITHGPAEFAKLQKVLDLRVMRAKRAYLEKRAEYDALVAEAEVLQQEADELHDKYQKLVEQLSGNSTVDTLKDITTRRYWLNSDYEMKKYYLEIANGDVEEAEEELLILKKVSELEQSDSVSAGGVTRG